MYLIQIEETFCGRTDVRTDISPPLILLGRLLEVDLKSRSYNQYNINTLHSMNRKITDKLQAVQLNSHRICDAYIPSQQAENAYIARRVY